MAGNPLEQGYITVAERHAAFVADHPNGVIHTDVVNTVYDAGLKQGFVVVKAKVWKERKNAVAGEIADGTGLASMPIPGVTNFTKNSEVENTETSAIGRALAAIGYHPKETMASQDEISAKTDSGSRPAAPAAEKATGGASASGAQKGSVKPLSDAQRGKIFALAGELGLDKDTLGKIRLDITGKHSSTQMTMEDGKKLIDHLLALKEVQKVSGGEVVG